MFKLSRETKLLLEDIERRIDPEIEDRYLAEWRDFLYDRFDGDIFSPVRAKKRRRRWRCLASTSTMLLTTLI